LSLRRGQVQGQVIVDIELNVLGFVEELIKRRILVEIAAV
jgi:uncharacterized membrane protein YqaE (UPF0057 family)